MRRVLGHGRVVVVLVVDADVVEDVLALGVHHALGLRFRRGEQRLHDQRRNLLRMHLRHERPTRGDRPQYRQHPPQYRRKVRRPHPHRRPHRVVARHQRKHQTEKYEYQSCVQVLLLRDFQAISSRMIIAPAGTAAPARGCRATELWFRYSSAPIIACFPAPNQ